MGEAHGGSHPFSLARSRSQFLPHPSRTRLAKPCHNSAAATTTTVVFTPPPPPSSPAAAQICGIHVPKPPVSVLRPGSGLSTPFGLPCDRHRHPPHCLIFMREDNDDSATIDRLGRPLALLAWAAAWASQSSPAGATVNGTTLCIHSIPSASLFSSPD